MSDAVALIQRLGWEWRPDGASTGAGPGVLFSVQLKGGRVQRVFVPLARVWVVFDEELQKVGCIGSASCGAPFSVGGFFSFVKKAASSVVNTAKSAVKTVAKATTSAASSAAKATALAVKNTAKAVVPKAIQKAAARVVQTAKNAVNAVTKIPIIGSVAKAAANLVLLPQIAAVQLLQGKRIDHVAIDSLKRTVQSAKTIAPYVQTVISVVPGVGQGISAGLGGALALAEGQSITQAVEAAVKGAIPGGPLAQAAFSIASGVMQGKPIDQIAVNALPISPGAKQLLTRGLSAAKDLAAGKRVDQVLLDQALQQLPPQLQKAVQIGTALGHAKNLQSALGAAAQGASMLANTHAAGVEAAKAFASGVRSPAITNALQRAADSKQALTRIVSQAQQGHPQATHIVNALRSTPLVSSRPWPPQGVHGPMFGGLFQAAQRAAQHAAPAYHRAPPFHPSAAAQNAAMQMRRAFHW